MDIQNLWQTILADLKLQVSRAVYQTLLSQTTLESLDNNTATISCNRPMLINIIEKKYSQILKKTLNEYTKGDYSLVFTSKHSISTYIDGPLFTMKRPDEKTSSSNVRLNQDYTFENFAVSSSNQMAYAAATAVAKSPGSSYNPMFLYGGVGVGKTHLMQGIAHYILKQDSKIKLIFCTGEEFTNEIIEAIGHKTTTVFKKRYRRLDLFLIDDVQFIAGKNAVQEEFFHTFNAIAQGKGQVVMTSDKPPEEINRLETRLRSRFEGGLTIDIGPPDFELRTAILMIKAKQRKIDLSIDNAKLLAANIDTIRKLEGVFIRVLAESQTRNIPIDSELIKNILGKTLKEAPNKKEIPLAEVINTVASYFNIKLSQLKGAKRDKAISLPRQMLYYILRVEVGAHLMEIGDILGGRDHTTIMHGVRKITNLLSTDEKIRGDIMGIKNRLFG